MEPPRGFFGTLWKFFYFMPFFLGLLLLGTIKGALICPIACLIITIGNSAIILSLWPAHAAWTFYCIVRSYLLGPVLKLVLCTVILVLLLLWPFLGIVGSILAGAVYGFLMPVMATFDAIGEGKQDKFLSCISDGIWSTIKGSCTVVRDMKDVCFHSYFSIMDDLHLQEAPNGMPYEISCCRRLFGLNHFKLLFRGIRCCGCLQGGINLYGYCLHDLCRINI
ncbi:hypothetical protein HPP92_008270 [Vanilla planifolia]|uniref:Uncharacterized protein n=1 Tax=Vanilla planifolia TaxID=51239 RepID=A0A835R277_VANPL|nr:hypothetical protein HPP92_008270 [Vanilla planifolia]